MLALVTHGVGGRSDLPLPAWMFSYGAGVALVASFVALGALWRRPVLAAAAHGRDLPAVVQRTATVGDLVLRAVGLVGFLTVLYAAGWGVDESASNIAPVALCVVFWVGVPMLSAVVGDVWATMNPYDTIARLLRIPETTGRPDPGQWVAAAMLFSFAWLELAYHLGCGAPRSVFAWMATYSAVALAGAFVWGRGWLRYGDGFAALFSLIALIAPLYRDESTGRLRLRLPCSGLATMPVRSGTSVLVFVALGSTAFDGLTRSTFWEDIVGQRTGWARTGVATIGLTFTICVVALAYLAATRVTAKVVGADPVETGERFVASLIPIVVVYAVAHYFSLLVFEGQNFLALASDPFGRGWDLFGTIANSIDYTVVSTGTIAWVQVAAIVIGHVIGVAVAHDRAVESYEAELATASQYPLLAVMVLYTVGGLGLLLGA